VHVLKLERFVPRFDSADGCIGEHDGISSAGAALIPSKITQIRGFLDVLGCVRKGGWCPVAGMELYEKRKVI
jgi:hypothetical protein